MMLVIEVPDMTEDHLAELENVIRNLVPVLTDSAELRWFAQSADIMTVTVVRPVEEAGRRNSFGASRRLWMEVS